MAEGYLDIAKVAVPVVAGIIGVAGGYLIKRWETNYQARKLENELWSTQKQTFWSPLLRAASDFDGRLKLLSQIYSRKPESHFDPDSLAADFRELYVLRRDLIANLQDADPNTPRSDERAVQAVRSRACHELTFAESSLYIAANYLGNAQHVWRALEEDLLILPEAARNEMVRLISGVRKSLQGATGAGVFSEQQEYIGETVFDTSGRVIDNLEFRKRLFELPGWEQFKNLLRFFVEFEPKLEFEVKATIQALEDLEERVHELRSYSIKSEYDALWQKRLPTAATEVSSTTADRAIH